MRSTMRRAFRLDPEGVLQGAGRVVGTEVEGVEVEPLGLDLGSLGDLPAHRHEDVGDVLGDGGQRVPGTDRFDVPRQRDVDPLGREQVFLLGGLDLGGSGREGGVDGAAGLADALAGLLAGLRRQRADLPVRQGQRRPVAGVVEPGLLERVDRVGGRDRSERLVAHPLHLVGTQRRDLDGVVVGVGRGHAGLSRSGSAVQSRVR